MFEPAEGPFFRGETMDRHRSITGLLSLMFVPACDGDQLTGSTILTATGGGGNRRYVPIGEGLGS